MTDSVDYRRVKETEVLAKKAGFTLGWKPSYITVHSTKKGLPCEIFGKSSDVRCFPTIEEVRAFLWGWCELLSALDHIDFDIEEYKKRRNDVNVMNALKGKKKR